MKVLSISVAAYNASGTLEKCLDSMVKSRCIDSLEIIVVNDGSKDNTLEIAQRYAQKYPESVIVIDKENGGHGSTINASIIKSSGKYFKLVDSDDWVDTENLDKLIDYLKNSEIDMAINPYYEVNSVSFVKNKIKVLEEMPTSSFNLSSIKELFWLPMASLTFNTRLIKEMGPVIDEKCFYVDAEYVLFLVSKVRTAVGFDYPIYNYALGNVNQSVSVQSIIKNVNQHKLVVHRLLHFLNSEAEIYNYDKVKYCINLLVMTQYRIYTIMPYPQGKKEFIEFDKSISNELVNSLDYKWKAFIKLNRISNYILFHPMLKALRLLGIGKTA